MPRYQHGLSRRQQGYLFANGIGVGGFANRWYRGVRTGKLPARVRGAKTRAQSRRVVRAAMRRRR
jgi:hypothetical protein